MVERRFERSELICLYTFGKKNLKNLKICVFWIVQNFEQRGYKLTYSDFLNSFMDSTIDIERKKQLCKQLKLKNKILFQ